MKFVLLSMVVFGVCRGATFNNVASGKGCSYPNWKCDCRLLYNCGGTSGLPSDFSDPIVAGVVKDLAPDDYQLRIPGKRWRREIWSQEEFCKRECYDRMNAFLCLDPSDGSPSDYSYQAICTKLLVAPNPNGPFFQTGPPMLEPCCEVYLEWGLDWCPDKWSKLEATVHCLTLSAIDLSAVVTGAGAVTSVFSAVGGCSAGDTDFSWCNNAPTCGP